jgi:hypothetical protein
MEFMPTGGSVLPGNRLSQCEHVTPFLSMKLPPPPFFLSGGNQYSLRAGRGGPREGQTNTEGVSSWGKL